MKHQMTQKSYTPISCDLYDEFEALATLRKRVAVHFYDHSVKTFAEGTIKDFKIRDKVEYMILDTDLEIRLDHLISVNDLILSEWQSCSRK